jgi:hypothetical protein
VIRRIAGMVIRPRLTMAELVGQPVWALTWLSILVLVGACAAVLLVTEVGRQAVVDERVRVIEMFGGAVDDGRYAELQAAPPWWVYFASGGRLLLTPAVTLLAALACWAIARRDGAAARFRQALAIVVHATVVLAIGQLIATPISYVHESLSSPITVAAILPGMEEGTVPARFFGVLDVFTLWWIVLVAIGVAALTRRGVRRYVVVFLSVYFAFAAIMAGTVAAVGGI